MAPYLPLLHHGEPADPTLLGWINDLIHSVVGAGPLLAAVVLGSVILAIPASLLFFALRHRAGQDRPD